VTDNTPLCYGHVTRDYDPWFSDDPHDQAVARTVCRQCPVAATCMVVALVNDFEYGIFAATTPDERKPLREKLFNDLDADHVAALTDKYFMPDIMEDYRNPSVEAKYRRRRERAETCRALLMDAEPHEVGDRYPVFLACVEAVLDNPAGTGEQLGHAIGKSGALFNQRLRECFEYFNMDMSVL
jgi:hypothetical protein